MQEVKLFTEESPTGKFDGLEKELNAWHHDHQGYEIWSQDMAVVSHKRDGVALLVCTVIIRYTVSVGEMERRLVGEEKHAEPVPQCMGERPYRGLR